MKKLKFGTVVLSTLLVCSTQVNAYTLEIKSDKKEISSGDQIVVTVKMNDLEELIDTYQGKLVYDFNDFKMVTSSDFNLKNGWEGLAYNKDNGVFIVEKSEKTKESQDVLSITMESQKNLEKDDITIRLEDNLVSGGNADISTTNVEIKMDVAKEFGYEIIQDKYIGPVKTKTPIEDFKTIFSKNLSSQIQVWNLKKFSNIK